MRLPLVLRYSGLNLVSLPCNSELRHESGGALLWRFPHGLVGPVSGLLGGEHVGVSHSTLGTWERWVLERQTWSYLKWSHWKVGEIWVPAQYKDHFPRYMDSHLNFNSGNSSTDKTSSAYWDGSLEELRAAVNATTWCHQEGNSQGKGIYSNAPSSQWEFPDRQ